VNLAKKLSKCFAAKVLVDLPFFELMLHKKENEI